MLRCSTAGVLFTETCVIVYVGFVIIQCSRTSCLGAGVVYRDADL